MTRASPIEVAVGIVRNTQGRVLLGQRPPDKLYAGYWEFPGGKIEPGETVAQALARELREELGLEVESCRPLMCLVHRYPEYAVRLWIREVRGDCERVHARENQALAWVAPDELSSWSLLPADGPIVTAIRLPAQYVFTAPDQSADSVLAGIGKLPRGSLLRLRLPGLEDADYRELAREAVAAASRAGIGVMLDREPEMLARLGACGLHLSQARLQSLTDRPELPPGRWLAASVHDPGSLAQAARFADFVVCGPVAATATHPGATPLGLDGLARLCELATVPVYAIGGLGQDQLDAVRIAGAQGLAGISAYWSEPPAGG